MLHLHATQKLLNTSRIKPVLYISEPNPGQYLHNWYVTLCGSGFSGKFLILYVHDPSLMTILVKGKTIASTFEIFQKQLRQLLYRHDFPIDFIEKELANAEDYVVGKTNNKAMLGHINQMIRQVTSYNVRFTSYEEIDTTVHEDIFMRWYHHKPKGQKDYQTPMNYWIEILGNKFSSH